MAKLPTSVSGAVMATGLSVVLAACSCSPTLKSTCETQGSTYLYSKEQPGDPNDGSCVKPGATALTRGTAETTTEVPPATDESTTTEAASSSTIAAVATATSATPAAPARTTPAPTPSATAVPTTAPSSPVTVETPTEAPTTTTTTTTTEVRLPRVRPVPTTPP